MMMDLNVVPTSRPQAPVTLHRATSPDFAAASLFAIGVAIVPLVLLSLGSFGDRPAFVLISFATTVMGLRVFVFHGSHTVTATGVYFLAVATFGGLGGLLLAVYDPSTIDTWSVFAGISVYLTSLVAYHLFLRRTSYSHSYDEDNWQHSTVLVSTRSGPYLALWLGPSVVVVSIVLSLLGLAIGPLARELAYCGVLLTAGVLLLPSHRRAILRRPRYVWLTIFALGAYFARFFTGYGRLNLATIALALFILHMTGGRAKWAKLGIVLGLVPFLAIGGIIGASRSLSGPVGQQRSTYQFDARADVISHGEGLQSVMSPLARSAELIRTDNRPTSSTTSVIGSAHGSTFMVALIPWIPRSWWPAKPYGFGRELAILLTPYDDGHSEAALIHGEWYYNFGVFGFLLMVPMHGYLLSRLDRRVLRATRLRPRSVQELIGCLIPVVLAVGLADYVWMGAFTYMSRAGIRAILLVALYLLVRGVLVRPPALRAR